MSNEVKLVGTSQVLANFSKIEADLLNKAGVAIQEVVLQATYEAKRNAPVDLGGWFKVSMPILTNGNSRA